MAVSTTDIYGWTSITEADLYLTEQVYGGTQWDTLTDDEKRALLNMAANDFANSPAYSIPEYAGTAWLAESTANQERIAQAQTLRALDIVRQGGGASMHDEGVKEYSIGKFSKTFKDSGNKPFEQAYQTQQFSQRIRDLLRPWIRTTPIVGMLRRSYYGE